MSDLPRLSDYLWVPRVPRTPTSSTKPYSVDLLSRRREPYKHPQVIHRHLPQESYGLVRFPHRVHCEPVLDKR